MILSFLPILLAFIAHFRLFSCLSPKGEKLTDKTEKEIPLQINPSQSLRTKKVLASFDRWLFDEPMNGDIETIVATMDHLYGNIGTVLESEEEQKAANGIGQMLRMAQRKTFGQIAEERKEKEHALWERLRRRVEDVQKKNLFLANTLAIWAERMPFLVKRLSDQKVGTKNCDKLVKAIESLCECLVDQKFPSWKSFCEELSKLKDKEKKQWEERIARNHQTEEKMRGIFPSPRGDGIGNGAIMSPQNEKMPNLEMAVSPEGTSKVPTLDLNASQFMQKRMAKSDEQQKTHKTQLKMALPAELNVPTLDLNAARLSMKRISEKNKGKFTTAEETKNETKEKQ